MDGMEPLRIYDYLVLTRGKVLDAVRPLSAEQYGRSFPIGPGSLGRTLTHIMISEWYYVQRLEGHEVPSYENWPIQDEKPPPFPGLERTWKEQADRTRAALAAVPDWHAEVEYRVTDDDGRHLVVTTTAGDLATQLALHEIHHRAQVLNMLRSMDVTLEDLDFNALMFTRREKSPSPA